MSYTHEDFGRKLHTRGPSDRNFGTVFAIAFLVFGLSPLRHGKPIRIWCLALSVVLLLVTLIRPALLHVANRMWTQCGILLGRIVNPIVTGLLFFLIFTPAAVVLRWLGKDLLDLAKRPEASTYWIPRSDDEVLSDMRNQF